MASTAGSANSNSADPEQDKWLDEAMDHVKKQAFFMKRAALDNNNIREALKCASAMIGELRTGKLSPKNYYELYMNVTEELRELDMYFEEEDDKETRTPGAGRAINELYENVQHAGNIIPRLYLLITVGAVYIKSKKAPAKDVLFDLVELCRGVQHPMRGLFLRSYLSQKTKDKLPDRETEYEGAGGSVKDAIEFTLQNFAEMNKLWVRMQHQGAVRDKARREKERRNLRQLVGINLVRLSEMRGVDLAVYKDFVLPRILEQIVNCKDTIAQEYLMDCVIQVFADEFHLATLETFLSTCGQLQESVNVKQIIITMMNRLVKDAGEGPAKDVELFALFHKYSSKVIQASPKMALTDILALQVALCNFASRCYPTRIDFVDAVLGFTAQTLTRLGATTLEQKCVKQVVELLSLPLEAFSLQILNLSSYGPLMAFLALQDRKTVAVSIVTAVNKAHSALDTAAKVDTLFKYIGPLLKDEVESKKVEDEDRFEFDQEQHQVARLFQLVTSPDTDEHFKLYTTARKYFGQGGQQRIEYTLPPLVFGSLQLARRIYEREQRNDETLVVKTKKLFGFVHETIGALVKPYPELAMRLYLQGAQSADKCGHEMIAYEFMAQAFTCYEDEITDSKQQFNAITYISATLTTFTVFGKENYDTLISKATQHSAKLLKKPDQCRAVYTAAHLFWPGTNENPGHRDEKRVLVCLQRALKIANSCMGQQVQLFAEILNKYLYFFDKGCPSITVKYLKGLIALIDQNIPNLDTAEASAQTKVYYQNTLAHIKLKQSLDDEVGARYRELSEGGDSAALDVDA